MDLAFKIPLSAVDMPTVFGTVIKLKSAIKQLYIDNG